MKVQEFVSEVNRKFSTLADGLRDKAKKGEMGFGKSPDWGQGPGIG